MSYASEAVKKFRRNVKKRYVEAMGGECVICGYNKSMQGLCFHHIDPTKKEMNFGLLLMRRMVTVIKELKKCVCLCLNCHAEVHAGITKLPQTYAMFDDNKFKEIMNRKSQSFRDKCPVCGKIKLKKYKTCSNECHDKIKKSKFDYDKYDLKGMHSTMSLRAIAKIIGCTDNSVKKKLIKLGIYKSKASIA